MSSIDTAVIVIKFDDGEATLGANGELFLTPDEGSMSLDAARLELIKTVYNAQVSVEESYA